MGWGMEGAAQGGRHASTPSPQARAPYAHILASFVAHTMQGSEDTGEATLTLPSGA